jgi:hypothetical protein
MIISLKDNRKDKKLLSEEELKSGLFMVDMQNITYFALSDGPTVII